MVGKYKKSFLPKKGRSYIRGTTLLPVFSYRHSVLLNAQQRRLLLNFREGAPVGNSENI